MEEIKVADTARYVSFYAYDSTDHISPADGITGFTVYYYLNNGSATAMTTPTVAEKDSTNMKGWYTLAVDEAGMVSAEGVTSINIEASGMDPVAIKVNVVGNTTKEIYDVVAPITHCATSGTVNVGSVSSGAYTDACTDDTSYWIIIESNNDTDVEFGFGLGVNRIPTNLNVVLFVSGTVSGTTNFYAYNYLTSSWDVLNYSAFGPPGQSDTKYRLSMSQDHVDTDGSVKIRVVLIGFGLTSTVSLDLVNVQSIDAGSIANGVKLGAQGKLDVNAEADTALTDYDPPTDTEMIARTLPTADYVVTTDTIAGVTTVTNLTNAPTSGDLTATMKTSVNDQVVDVMKTDTTSEMSQGAPPATPTFEEMVAYLYFKMRNKQETTASEDAIYNNAGDTKLFKSTISDNGTTFTKQEYGSGA